MKKDPAVPIDRDGRVFAAEGIGSAGREGVFTAGNP
jgi:hypothetical protein